VSARTASSELVRSLAPRYEKVLQEVYKPVGTSSDFTSTCAFPFGPASEFKQRLIVQTAGMKRDFESPDQNVQFLAFAGSEQAACTH